jgi:Protein of unknown function (DUF1569)
VAERRALAFASLDDVMPNVERVLTGHTTVGRWTLAQILNHLARAVHYTATAPPSTATPTSEQEVIRRRFFSKERFPDGVESPAVVLPPPGLDADAEADSLRAAIARLASRTGAFPAHPRLGPLTGEEWDRFHRMHCAHHLSFAVPIAGSAD